MTKSRLITAFLIALLVSGGCTYLLSRKMHHAASGVAPTKMVLAAAMPLSAGQVLKETDLKTVAWPTSVPLSGAFEKSKEKELVGRAVLYPLSTGEPIQDRDLAIPGMGLTVKIPPGMRALALRSDEVVGVAGFVFPGSHVDVLVTYRSGQSPEPTTATVLQDAEVLAAGHQVEPDPSGKPSTVNVVTLLVKPEDAERVVLASTQGSIHFVLRNSSDTKHVDDKPVQLSQLIPGVGPKPVGHRLVQHRPQPYVVETVMGNKRTTASFE